MSQYRRTHKGRLGQTNVSSAVIESLWLDAVLAQILADGYLSPVVR